MKFIEMNLDPSITNALSDNNIKYPTEIQEKTIQKVLDDISTNVIGQARTGSGKTLAYAIPMMERLKENNKHIQSLVIVPTRELVKQVSSVFKQITKYKQAKIVEIYGGVSIKNQIQKIRRGAQIAIATPGRLIDLYRRRQIGFKFVKHVALDEADRMLDMGFLPDINIILLEAMKDINPQLMLYSATLLDDIKNLVRNFTKGNEIFEVNVSEDNLVVENCEQVAYVTTNNKYKSFVKILRKEDPKISIIFAKTKRKTQEITKKLKSEPGLGLKIEYLNGDLTQNKREEIVKKFREKKINCLIGTNVLSRGLDFPKVSHVFNYDLPRDPEEYVHRIGRTARISGVEMEVAAGRAISILNPNDLKMLKNIEKLIEKPIERCNLPNEPFNRENNNSKSYKKKDFSNKRKTSSDKKRKNNKNYSKSDSSKTKKKNSKNFNHKKESSKISTNSPKKNRRTIKNNINTKTKRKIIPADLPIRYRPN